jgi:hypothetical protein
MNTTLSALIPMLRHNSVFSGAPGSVNTTSKVNEIETDVLRRLFERQLSAARIRCLAVIATARQPPQGVGQGSVDASCRSCSAVRSAKGCTPKMSHRSNG